MDTKTINSRLFGSWQTRFFLEYFGNSALFPIANILLEMLREGGVSYFLKLDPYLMLLSGLAQAFYLTRWETTTRSQRFLGNLVAPALYTLVESLFEWQTFWQSPNHLAWWTIAIIIGLAQALRDKPSGFVAVVTTIVETITRTSILLVMYIIFEAFDGQALTATTFFIFFEDRSHLFVSIVTLLLGLSISMSNLTAQRYLELLRETSSQLRTYSEWLLGPDLLDRAFMDPKSLSLTRADRTVLFMDIRNFTRWCEAQSPEAVVEMLNVYYTRIELALSSHAPIRYKFSADEVLAVFNTPEKGVLASLSLRDDLQPFLSQFNLGAGIGVHSGALVEGLLGSRGVKFYDVIGDTVNTAKRIEGTAGPGEIILSENLCQSLPGLLNLDNPRQVALRGKETELQVYPLKGLT